MVRALAGDRRIADTTLTIPHPYPEGAAEAWIAALAGEWEAGRGATYAITERNGVEPVGAISLKRNAAHAAAELGYWIAVDAWGRGYATEAARALCGWAFTAWELHRIQARHLLRNPASGRVMEKIGMRREGVLRGATRKWDRFEDLALYAMLAPEWRGGPDI